MFVNQIAHNGGARTAKGFCPLLQERDVLAFHFQCDGFHAARVFLLWQLVNTGKGLPADRRFGEIILRFSAEEPLRDLKPRLDVLGIEVVEQMLSNAWVQQLICALLPYQCRKLF